MMKPVYGILDDFNMSHYGAVAIISMYVHTYIYYELYVFEKRKRRTKSRRTFTHWTLKK